MTIDRKQQILEAATNSFSLFGYKATTMDQIAKLANVGKGTIYTFYKNKEELFHEIISSLILEMKLSVEKTVSEDSSFYEKVDSALFALLEFRTDHQLMIKLIQEEKEMGTPAVKDVIQKIENAIVQYVGKIVQKAVDKGEIKPCNPEITAFVIIKIYIALIFDWEKAHKPLEKDEISRLFKLYLLNGLSNR
ncbi:TetR family transcriptional regulator [Siminovitchia terrae]|uniref:TetR family transcriptional regulator n=1 Tax=Siminovitchia terrae TaxID=1914933 RepID=A0A429X9A9_SIMTE|nr:TetR/AcrR family transcriptional regulator [Siminovitchia terrae]RST59783.1 TetR/AcrR family transcriptional regulator [Siminovitchia terrae]GIN91676.1 TetR family transcriptional regulator [Siminovitchia terrae]GIN95767.1 TetR family transcriptional regulator [Siminovitchia terrae]